MCSIYTLHMITHPHISVGQKKTKKKKNESSICFIINIGVSKKLRRTKKKE